MWGIRKTSWDGPDSRVVFALDFWTSVRCLVSSCLRDDPSTTSMLFYTMISIWFFDLKLLFALSKYFHNFHLRSLDSFFSFGPQEYWMPVTRLFRAWFIFSHFEGKMCRVDEFEFENGVGKKKWHKVDDDDDDMVTWRLLKWHTFKYLRRAELGCGSVGKAVRLRYQK